MADETPFRLALAGVMALNLAVVGYFRWQAAQSGEPIPAGKKAAFAAVLTTGLCCCSPRRLPRPIPPLGRAPCPTNCVGAAVAALCSLALA